MDLGAIIGIIAGVVVITLGLFNEGGEIGQFYNAGALLITLGGCFCAALVQFSFRDIFIVLPRQLWRVLRPPLWNREALISEFRRYADTARRNGILALETVAAEIADPFLKRGIQYAVDGTDPRVVEDLMRTDLELMVRRHERGIRILRALAGYAPAFGLVGTLLGQVVMLGNLKQGADTIGKAMSLAIVNTLYGVLLAYLIFGPLAEKLTIISQEEETVSEMVIRGVMGLQSGDNPSVLEQKLTIYAAARAQR